MQLFSFLGIGAGKQAGDIVTSAYTLLPGARDWQSLPPVGKGGARLAASAVAVGGAVYLMGGYTVAEDGAERSVATLLRFDYDSRKYTTLAPIPVAVDDAVALAYRDRYIYLVSGWHDSGNVNLIQLFDTHSGQWTQATPKPGHAVFGHAGAIHDNVMLLADGVVLEYTLAGERKFTMSNEVFLGHIHAHEPARIDWRRLPPHPGRPRYRAAATATTDPSGKRWFVFAGGTNNPYNFNGIGYDGQPSSPLPEVIGFQLKTGRWQQLGRLRNPAMDQRGLLAVQRGLVTVGGMRQGQAVTAEVSGFMLSRE